MARIMTRDELTNITDTLKARYNGVIFAEVFNWESLLQCDARDIVPAVIEASKEHSWCPTPAQLIALAAKRTAVGPLSAVQFFQAVRGEEIGGAPLAERLATDKRALKAILALTTHLLAAQDPDAMPALERWFMGQF